MRLTGWYSWEVWSNGHIHAIGYARKQPLAVRDGVAVMERRGWPVTGRALLIHGPGGGQWYVDRDPDHAGKWVCRDMETHAIARRIR